ncbi:DUF427 domain-containing protein [Mycobacterium sp. 1274756.6]|uniref:DUF427 domain-containing protein n=1 Tax=Mycobacterium sp. 1274756.6 TaxID=1834076 RepID=UPI0007FEC465|nr:DUF427 domain-containing protein [Mycobacterium sp. 1274756.6]OBJ67469.1 hypothetical protein A5643_17110 [Mycobacterium sp. 1274756.6]
MTEANDRPVLVPTADHPITVTPTGHRVTVRCGGQLIADTENALTVREAGYPAVQYIPLADADPAALSGTDSHSYCPFKGEASYYRIRTADGNVVDDAAWTYRRPHPAVAAIGGHVAFYPRAAQISIAPD